MDHQILAADGHVGQPPLVAAMHPGGEHPAARAGCLTRLGGHRDPHRRAPREHPLDSQTGKVREQHRQPKIGARSTIFRDSAPTSALRDRCVTQCVPEPVFTCRRQSAGMTVNTRSGNPPEPPNPLGADIALVNGGSVRARPNYLVVTG
jgi:hypothetical protein